LGVALGWLVGALVLGSASAHGIRALSVELPWATVIISVALLAAAGGLILFMAIPEPPNDTASSKKLEWQALATIWTDWRVRASVLGYFGHMWELYTFWVLVPLILATQLNGQALSFAAFGPGVHRGRLGRKKMGQCSRGHSSIKHERYLLSFGAMVDVCAANLVLTLAGYLGHHCSRRLASIFNPHSQQCA
jgi:hypothetical protein